MIIENPILNLKYYRELKKISQNELALKTLISQSYISEIELGKKNPTIKIIYRFAHVLDICPRLLLPCIIECKEQNNCECELNLNEGCDIQQEK